MRRRLSMATRRELIAAVRARYAGAPRTERAKILDELVAVAGYHRKHAIRLLGAKHGKDSGERRRPRPRYDEAVREALIALWEASDRICGKRLTPCPSDPCRSAAAISSATVAASASGRPTATSACRMKSFSRAEVTVVSDKRGAP